MSRTLCTFRLARRTDTNNINLYYKGETFSMKELTYTGWKVWEPTDEEFAEMFVSNKVPF